MNKVVCDGALEEAPLSPHSSWIYELLETELGLVSTRGQHSGKWLRGIQKQSHTVCAAVGVFVVCQWSPLVDKRELGSVMMKPNTNMEVG